MKLAARILAILLIFASVYEVHKGRVDGAILMIVWSFYMRYISDQNN